MKAVRESSFLLKRGSYLLKGALGLAVAVLMVGASSFISQAAEGKVTADTAKIRAEASTDSAVVGSTQKGKVIDIQGAVKDSSGTVWYKVPIEGGAYGYIRSDLVETSETIEITNNTSSQSQNTNAGGSKPAETVPTAIGEQQAVIQSSSGNVRIRSGASTQHDVVTSLPNGTSITLIGEANDSAGNKWYQLRCNYNGRDVEGYVRSDLIVIGSNGGSEGEAAPAEGENSEGGENQEGTGEGQEGGEDFTPEQPAEPEYNDYEVVYTHNEAGEYGYYLFDNINKNMQSVTALLGVADTANQRIGDLQKQVDNGKIVIIILAVIIVLLFIVMTVLILKIRSLYYEDYDEEDEEEEEEDDEDEEEDEPEPAPVKSRFKKRVQVEEEEEDEEPPVKKRRENSQSSAGKSRVRALEQEDAHVTQQPKKKPASKKPQNFLVDDDEFEFEFLNMDDKDL